MKRTFVLLLIGFVLTSLTVQKEIVDFDLIGKWKVVDEGDVGYFTFDENGYTYIDFENQKFGGKEFLRGEKKFSLTYRVDYSLTPITVDLIFTELDNPRELIMPCMIQVINSDKIYFARGSGNQRPKDFNGPETIIFERIKQN